MPFSSDHLLSYESGSEQVNVMFGSSYLFILVLHAHMYNGGLQGILWWVGELNQKWDPIST